MSQRLLPWCSAAVVAAVLAVPGLADPSRALVDDGAWIQFEPLARGGHSVIHDPARSRLIAFGGTDPIGRNDVWSMPVDGSTGWRPLDVSGPPPLRIHHTAILDPLRDRMLVFGGDSSSVRSNQVWALALSGIPSWQLLATAGTPPSPRSWHASVYDPLRDRLLVFGGNDGAPRDDLWELTLAGTPTWTPVATSGTPPARYAHSLIYDSLRDRLVVHGGEYDSFELPLDDVWELPLGGAPAWSPMTPLGTPVPRSRHAALYDAVNDAMVVFSGYESAELQFAPPVAWAPIVVPDELHLGDGEFGLVADPVSDRLIVFGGSFDLIRRGSETWVFDLIARQWARLGPDVPAPRQGHTMVYDPTSHRLLLHGGARDFDDDPVDRVWVLRLGDSQAWEPLDAPGGGPASASSAIVAPTRNSMILLGAPPGSPATAHELGLGATPAWSPLATAGAPPAHPFHTAVYDVSRDRIVVFGGEWTNQAWELALSGTPTWSLLAPAGTPPLARASHSAIYDPVGDRMLVFAGRTGPSTLANDVWQLAFSPAPTWSQLAPAGTPPQPREGAGCTLDPGRRRMLVFGSQGNHSDVWALSLEGAPAWTKLTPPNRGPIGRYRVAAAFDPIGDRLAIFGGWWNNGLGLPYYFNDTWMLGFDGPLAVGPRPDAKGVAMAAPAPNPARHSTAIAFSLRRAGEASLAVVDAAGRRVRTLLAGRLAAGAHSARWDLTDARGVRVPAGVYWLELRAGESHRTRKTVVIE